MTLLRTFLPLDTGFLGTYNFLNFFFLFIATGLQQEGLSQLQDKF